MKLARSQFLTLLLFITATLSVGLCVHGQDDPFNDDPFQASPFDEKPGEEVESAAVDPALLDESALLQRPDPILESIIGADPKTPAALIKTIDMLLNLERIELAKDYLKTLVEFQLDDEQSYTLYKEIGPDTLFRMQFSSKLGAEATKFAKSVFVGAENFATDAKRVETLVEEVVNNEDRYMRSVALNNLKLLGDSGAAVLLAKLVDNGSKDKWPRIRQAIRRFGKSAEGPLLAARHSNSLKLQIEALHLLESVPTEPSTQNIMLPLWSTSSTDLQRRVAQQSIRKLTGGIPSQQQCEETLYHSGRRYLMDQKVVESGANDQVKWWYWDQTSRSMKPVWLTPRTVMRNRGFRRAKDLIELNPTNRDYQELYWVTRLESAKLTAGVNQPLPAMVLQTLAGSIQQDMAQEVLREALSLRRIPAAIAACELIGAISRRGNQQQIPIDFLASRNGQASPLVKALDFGSVRLTNAACDAIYQIDPQRPFTGSSNYLSSLVFLSQSVGRKTALVAHVNLEKARSIATLVNRNGFNSYPAVTPQQLFTQAKQDPDLQLLVITDSLSRPGFSELVQALRSSPRTRLIPILLMVKPENMNRGLRLADRFDSILVTPMAINDLVMARQIDNLQSNLSYRDADSVERSDQAVNALKYLGRYASDRNRYSFFNLPNYEKQLLGSLGTPANAASTCQLMGKLGTSDAQINLVDIASNNQLPAALRTVAADSFREAVQNRGLMISRDQILIQYQRYNSSASQPADTQQVLGHLLDTIEKRGSSAKKTEEQMESNKPVGSDT